ncbi:glycoside hydrolase family 99-like domain-containing protein [Kolteria novifilia]|uniref:glycoside hydrolase family 99-like domain-containing protein n=1 Tax=Kolteria novifilia TaxID=2527975 RepID=UPI003AF3F267
MSRTTLAKNGHRSLVIATVVGLAATSALLGPTLAQDVPQRPLVLAYYYPWYEKGDWSRHGYVGTPTLGRYGTDEPTIAEQHIAWAREGGIDAFVVSWWGEVHLTARHLDQGFFRASNLDTIRFAMIYESLGRLDHLDGNTDAVIDFSHPEVAAGFAKDLRHLRETYFGHRSYLHVDGKPVLVLYVTRTFRNFDPRQLAAAEATAGTDVYFIADEPFFGDQQSPETARNGLRDGRPVFDAYTTYNMFENALVKEGETAGAYMRREAKPIVDRWARSTVFYPNVLPSYHDFRGHKTLRGSVDDFRAQIKEATRITNPSSAPDAPRMLFVTSFNEWWEGTTIEPAKEYGHSYLNTLREAVEDSSK